MFQFPFIEFEFNDLNELCMFCCEKKKVNFTIYMSPDSVLVSRVNINGEAEETTVTLLSGPVHGSGQY